jgi:hypothetical protein
MVMTEDTIRHSWRTSIRFGSSQPTVRSRIRHGANLLRTNFDLCHTMGDFSSTHCTWNQEHVPSRKSLVFGVDQPESRKVKHPLVTSSTVLNKKSLIFLCPSSGRPCRNLRGDLRQIRARAGHKEN